MNKNPFEIKSSSRFNAEWKEGDYLGFDQSSVDPRFGSDYLEEQPASISQVRILGLILFIFGILILRLVQLGVLDSDQYRALAEGNRLRTLYLQAPRGNIYDSEGTVLARNEPGFELVATPFDLPKDETERDALYRAISERFDLTVEQIHEALANTDGNSFLPVTIKTSVPKEDAIEFLTRSRDFVGFTVENVPKRIYPLGNAASHLLGYPGKLTESDYADLKQQGYIFNDYIGKSGLELQYESDLRGILGQRLVEVDAQGIVKSEFQRKPPDLGSDLHLNINARLQEIVYNELERELLSRNGKRGAAVALDPRTGGILALVSFPSFDNNLFSTGISSNEYQQLITNEDLPLFNRAIAGTYPPGSTVKPFFSVGGLAEGVVDEDTIIVDRGAIHVPNQYNPSIVHTFRGWVPQGLGPMDVYDAIAMSSDIYFYTLGGGQQDLGIDGIGVSGLAFWMQQFFIGRKTGIDLPSEREGLIPTAEWKRERFADSAVDRIWYLGDTYNMSIGQGFVLVTPLQLAVATAAIANNGTIYQPQIVSRIVDREGLVRQEVDPQILNENFAPATALAAAQKGMRRTVTNGTSVLLNSLPVAVAGKTGSAQVISNNLTFTHSWFTSYAPYESPEIVLTVIVEAGAQGTGPATVVTNRVYSAWYGE